MDRSTTEATLNGVTREAEDSQVGGRREWARNHRHRNRRQQPATGGSVPRRSRHGSGTSRSRTVIRRRDSAKQLREALVFNRAVEAYLVQMHGVSWYRVWKGIAEAGATDAKSGRAVGEPDGRRDAPAHRQHRNRLRVVRHRLEARRAGRDRGAGQSCSAACPTCGSARSWASAPPAATRARAASSCCCRRITTAPRPTDTWLPNRRPIAWCSACVAFNRPAAPRRRSR